MVHSKEELNKSSDNELLALSVTNPEVFEVLVDRYQEPFLNKITAMLRNREQVEDIVQDTFVKIYLNASKFEEQEGASFKSWGYKILINTCFTFCKKKKREREIFEMADQETLDLMRVSDSSQEDKLVMDEFLRAVSKIPNALGRVLKTAVISGKSHEAIAAEEGISLSAARTRLHRAKKEFKKVHIS